jgi:hypothetical protein
VDVRASDTGGACSIPSSVPSSAAATAAVAGVLLVPTTVPGASVPWNVRRPPRFRTPSGAGNRSVGLHVDSHPRDLGWVREASAPVGLAACKRGGSTRVLAQNQCVFARVRWHLPQTVLRRVRRRRGRRRDWRRRRRMRRRGRCTRWRRVGRGRRTRRPPWGRRWLPRHRGRSGSAGSNDGSNVSVVRDVLALSAAQSVRALVERVGALQAGVQPVRKIRVDGRRRAHAVVGGHVGPETEVKLVEPMVSSKLDGGRLPGGHVQRVRVCVGLLRVEAGLNGGDD